MLHSFRQLRGTRAFAAAVCIAQGVAMTAGCLVLAACPSSSSRSQDKVDHVAPQDPPAPPRRLWLFDGEDLRPVPDVVVLPVPDPPAEPPPFIEDVEEL